ncbi:ribonuclease III domain-containing protein [Crocosphaera chwakensis]|uniref:Ribonuclease III (Rnc) n=1 Tax=Crocosphaera chwakensis CCY0110 TaxID=391612 RepID=A3IUB1_9CHRO|nr:ribonuclease III domain-containing protein [Crocosphaera chwakensis]EAZ89892.1 ribonuclease III (rnc) [Crocosphaera chwakensis CCY0110]
MQWNSSLVQEKISFNFKNPELLFLSLSDPSYGKQINQPGSDNERLESLGETVLDLIIIDYLYHHFPYLTISKMTALRDKLSEKERLTNLWFGLGLGESYPFLDVNEERHRLRVKSSNPFEKSLKALVGAIHIDRGFSQSYNWVNKQLIAPLLERHQKDDKERVNPEKQVNLLGTTCLRTIAFDYLYRLLPYVSPGILNKLSKRLISKKQQIEYLKKLTKEDWKKITFEQDKISKKSFPSFIGAMFIYFDNENPKTRYRNSRKWFRENCINEDEVLYEAISLLLKEGIPQKWIIREILGYKSKNYDQGRERFYEIMDQSDTKHISGEEE